MKDKESKEDANGMIVNGGGWHSTRHCALDGISYVLVILAALLAVHAESHPTHRMVAAVIAGIPGLSALALFGIVHSAKGK